MSAHPFLITQAEYARHRGCSAAAVSKAVRAERITLVDGLVDVAAADLQWKQNTRTRVGSRGATEPASAACELVGADVNAKLVAMLAIADDLLLLARRLPSFRERLQRLPEKLASALAAETDPARIREILQAELRWQLKRLEGA